MLMKITSDKIVWHRALLKLVIYLFMGHFQRNVSNPNVTTLNFKSVNCNWHGL